MEITITIPDDWTHWSISHFPPGATPMGLDCTCKSTVMYKGHIIDVVGLGEDPAQAVQECERALADLRRREEE